MSHTATLVSPTGQQETGRETTRLIRLVVTWTMLVVGVISWRTGVYYEGGLDPVVLAKAMLTMAALGLAVFSCLGAPVRQPVGARTVVFVCLYLTVTTIGAWADGSLFASAVLSIRVLVVAGAVFLVVVSHPMEQVLESLCIAMIAVGLICVVTGIGSLASRGRLSGGLFPLNPNDIALLFGPAIILFLWRLLTGIGKRFDAIGAAGFTMITLLTGSRTGLLALLVAVVILILQARPLPVAAFIGSVAAIPAIAYLVVSTGLVSNYFERGGSANLNTLSSRTIAWQSAFSTPTSPWKHWFGGGLAVKTVDVTGTYWDTQVLDSSWVSGFVQGGVIGITLLGLWSLWSLGAATRGPSPWRSLWVAMVLYAIIRSLLSNGLIDAHILFVIMFLSSLATEPVTRGVRARNVGDKGRRV